MWALFVLFTDFDDISQGRSLRESTLRRAQRRSFTPASFMEEDVVDFPDELDTSFFARVRRDK